MDGQKFLSQTWICNHHMAGDMMMMMICRHMIGNQATLDRVEEQYLLVNNYWIFVTALNSWQPKSPIVALAMPEIWGEIGELWRCRWAMPCHLYHHLLLSTKVDHMLPAPRCCEKISGSSGAPIYFYKVIHISMLWNKIEHYLEQWQTPCALI